jgi:hypothetical protein
MKFWTGCAKGRRRHTPGQMNKLERAYALHLEAERIAGRVQWFAFEAITFKLASDCRLTVDFAVLMADDTLEMHEVKAWSKKKGKSLWEEDAKIKMRVAAGKYPLRFVAVSRTPSGWEMEEF